MALVNASSGLWIKESPYGGSCIYSVKKAGRDGTELLIDVEAVWWDGEEGHETVFTAGLNLAHLGTKTNLFDLIGMIVDEAIHEAYRLEMDGPMVDPDELGEW